MRKTLVASVAIVAALAVATVAYAANQYDIKAAFSPSKSGTKSNPVPVGITFGFKVTETTNQRPAALEALTIQFGGVAINGGSFPACTAAQINATQVPSDAKCKAGSLMASGYANNIAGDRANRADTSQRCYLTVKLYNGGTGKASLFVAGKPSPQGPADPKNCPLPIQVAIPVSVVKSAKGDSLKFAIPEPLKHPLPTITNGLVETQLKGAKHTAKAKGHTVGFFETVGGCVRGKRPITLKFDNEGTADDTTQSGTAKCS
jgi:hypothetical protein